MNYAVDLWYSMWCEFRDSFLIRFACDLKKCMKRQGEWDGWYYEYWNRKLMNSGEFPAQRQVTRSFYVPLICVWLSGWVNSPEAGDLDAIVRIMTSL